MLQTLTPLYVLVRATGLVSADGLCQVMCERTRDSESGPGTNAMVVYLSPFEACLDAAWHALAPERYDVLAASAFTPDELLIYQPERLPYCLHVAWGAHDGQLVVRRDGGLLRLSSAHSAPISRLIDAIHLRIELPVLESHERLWEQAGLYAHAESHARMLAASDAERHRQALQAIQRIPGTARPGLPVNQVALYDVESAQWHFVALKLFETIVQESGPGR
nr:hypothetical protein [Herbaspirillum sp. AP02]